MNIPALYWHWFPTFRCNECHTANQLHLLICAVFLFPCLRLILPRLMFNRLAFFLTIKEISIFKTFFTAVNTLFMLVYITQTLMVAESKVSKDLFLCTSTGIYTILIACLHDKWWWNEESCLFNNSVNFGKKALNWILKQQQRHICWLFNKVIITWCA